MSDTDFANQLEKLFELKEKGIISEEEFNQKKKEILDINSKDDKKVDDIVSKTNFNKPDLPKKKRGCVFKFLVIILSVFFFFVILGIIISNDKKSDLSKSTANIEDNLKSKIIFDTKAFIVDNNKTVTEAQLIEKIGEPDKIDNWNYTSAIGDNYPIKTLIYGNYEYNFNNGMLHRISILQSIPYETKDDFLNMFNVSKTKQSTLKDTGVAYRLTNASIKDLWIGYNDTTKKIEWVHISYSDLFE